MSLLIAAMSCAGAADRFETLRLQPAPYMSRANLHRVDTVNNPSAVLILCPGVNGDGEALVRSPKWIKYAKENQLGLVGLSFASPLSAIHDGTGYYYVRNGSGELLLQGIRKLFGRDLPLLFYGFSGGAHFTSRFVEWNPKRVLTWAAYSAGWWDEPKRSLVFPPGIVACGEEDHRYGASLIYFKQGRALGKPWLWVSLPHAGHTESDGLDRFVMKYFAAILHDRDDAPVFLDIDRKIVVSDIEAKAYPTLMAWLPTQKLLEEWRSIHGY